MPSGYKAKKQMKKLRPRSSKKKRKVKPKYYTGGRYI